MMPDDLGEIEERIRKRYASGEEVRGSEAHGYFFMGVDGEIQQYCNTDTARERELMETFAQHSSDDGTHGFTEGVFLVLFVLILLGLLLWFLVREGYVDIQINVWGRMPVPCPACML